MKIVTTRPRSMRSSLGPYTLKYRSTTTGKPMRAKAKQRCSAAALDVA